MDSSKLPKTISWFCQLVAAVIFLQTLFFKFTGAAESVYIFREVGMEPWGRIGSGIVELIASILLLWPRRAWIGAVLGVGTITSAIFFHLTVLGIEVQQDGGTLFMLALVVFACCSTVLYLKRKTMRSDIKQWFGKEPE